MLKTETTVGETYALASIDSKLFFMEHSHDWKTAKLVIMDTSGPWAPLSISQFPIGQSTLRMTAVKQVGDIAYVADGSGGLHIISMATPSEPVEIGRFGTLKAYAGRAGPLRD